MVGVLTNAAWRQFKRARLDPWVWQIQEKGPVLKGYASTLIIDAMAADERFLDVNLGALHGDVGHPRKDFRSLKGSLGSGSLQVVVNTRTGKFDADVDQFNPGEDVANFLGHAFGEVLPHWWDGIFGRPSSTGDKPS